MLDWVRFSLKETNDRTRHADISQSNNIDTTKLWICATEAMVSDLVSVLASGKSGGEVKGAVVAHPPPLPCVLIIAN